MMGAPSIEGPEVVMSGEIVIISGKVTMGTILPTLREDNDASLRAGRYSCRSEGQMPPPDSIVKTGRMIL